MEPHFLPKVKMDRKAEFPGWKVRPDNHTYETVYQGRVLRDINGKLVPDKKAHWLSGETVLIDTRLKPAYKNGKQMWKDDTDFLGPILENIRCLNQIAKYEHGSQSSRFGVSADDWEKCVKTSLENDKRFDNVQWRLERGAEGNVIPQMYSHMPRRDNGTTNTWVWHEEYFEDRSNRLLGGDSHYGGLSVFGWDWSGYRWNDRSFCPLAVL